MQLFALEQAGLNRFALLPLAAIGVCLLPTACSPAQAKRYPLESAAGLTLHNAVAELAVLSSISRLSCRSCGQCLDTTKHYRSHNLRDRGRQVQQRKLPFAFDDVWTCNSSCRASHALSSSPAHARRELP
jgi:hypothetical protein